MIEDNWTIWQRRLLQEYRVELFLQPACVWREEHLRLMIQWTEEAIAEHLEWKTVNVGNVIELEHYRR